jgi:(2R)-sulfolactate sulfo-lyase subunit alpha
VPLGHKFALRDIDEGADVIEYGVRVAVASRPIRKGEHVHVHNVRSARWQQSVAR